MPHDSAARVLLNNVLTSFFWPYGSCMLQGSIKRLLKIGAYPVKFIDDIRYLLRSGDVVLVFLCSALDIGHYGNDSYFKSQVAPTP